MQTYVIRKAKIPESLQNKRNNLLCKLMYGNLKDEESKSVHKEINEVNLIIKKYKSIVAKQQILRNELVTGKFTENERAEKLEKIKCLNEEKIRLDLLYQ